MVLEDVRREDDLVGGLGDVARASAGELVGIDEEAAVRITGVEGDHAVVDVLLGALALITRGEKAASGVGVLARFETGGLGVVVVTVAVFLGNVLEDDTPVAFNVDGATDLGVIDIGRAEIAFGSDPVGSVIGRASLRGAGVVFVLEGVLLIFGNVIDEIVGGLLGDVRVFLQEDRILADLGGDVVLGVFGILDAIGEVRVGGACGRGLGVAVTVDGGGMGSVRSGGGMGMRSQNNGDWNHQRGDQLRNHGLLLL